MNYSRINQNDMIGNIYLYQVNKTILSEQEQQQVKQQIQTNQLAAGIEQSGVAAKVEAKIKELSQDKNFLTQLEDAKKKNQLEQFLLAIANQITSSGSHPTVNTTSAQKNESHELNEALPSRIGSLASAARDRLMGDKPTSNLPLRVQAVLKHFEKLKTNVGSHLRELQRDMETTSNVDVKVKNIVNQFVTDLGDTTAMHGGITPTQSKLGDIRHTAGRLVGFGAAAATVAAAVAPLGAAVAGIAGLKGLGAAAASSALKGGVFKSLHSLATGQGIPKATEVAKIMAISALGGAAGAKIGSILHDLATKPIEAIKIPGVMTKSGYQATVHGDLSLPNNVTDPTLGGLAPQPTTDFVAGEMQKADLLGGDLGVGSKPLMPADITPKQFAKFNKTSFNPASRVDAFKKAVMGFMKADTGNIDANAYNRLVNPSGGREALKGMLKNMTREDIIRAAAQAVRGK